MPPLFHALHHNTLVDAPKPFIPRDQRGTLPEAGENALVGLCNLDFAKNGVVSKDIRRPTVKMPEFYKQGHGGTLVERAARWGYFEVEGGHWDLSKVGPLGALWLVILNEDGTPAWFDEHLGGGYRLWHYLSHNANRNFFAWKFYKSKDNKKSEVDIQIGVTPSGHKWQEQVGLKLKLEWK